MNLLLIVLFVVWLAFFGLWGAYLWARHLASRPPDDPFLAATSGKASLGAASQPNDDLDNTLRQMNESTREAQRAAWRQSILRRAPLTLAGLAVVLVLLVGTWKAGLLNGGHERKTVSYHGTFYSFSTTKRGYSLGTKKVYARAGQSLIIDYNFESGSGNLLVFVKRLHAGWVTNIGEDPLWLQSLKAPGHFTAHTAVPETGWYEVFIVPSAKREHQMTYDVRWKVE